MTLRDTILLLLACIVSDVPSGNPRTFFKLAAYIHPRPENFPRQVHAVYEGDYTDGKRAGLGKMTYPNGDVYTGQWKDNAMSGEGTYEYKVPDRLSVKCRRQTALAISKTLPPRQSRAASESARLFAFTTTKLRYPQGD